MTTQSTSAYERKRMRVCPICRRNVETFPQLDGLNRPIDDKPFRFSTHTGPKWGRQCANSGELVS